MTGTTEVARTARATRTSRRAGSAVVVAAFTAAAFAGACLLFVVQRMFARLVLPAFGGSATVWSTTSLFFQVLLLVGYVYTHVSTRRLGPRWQPALHLVVLLVAVLVLPLANRNAPGPLP